MLNIAGLGWFGLDVLSSAYLRIIAPLGSSMDPYNRRVYALSGGGTVPKKQKYRIVRGVQHVPASIEYVSARNRSRSTGSGLQYVGSPVNLYYPEAQPLYHIPVEVVGSPGPPAPKHPPPERFESRDGNWTLRGAQSAPRKDLNAVIEPGLVDDGSSEIVLHKGTYVSARGGPRTPHTAHDVAATTLEKKYKKHLVRTPSQSSSNTGHYRKGDLSSAYSQGRSRSTGNLLDGDVAAPREVRTMPRGGSHQEFDWQGASYSLPRPSTGRKEVYRGEFVRVNVPAYPHHGDDLDLISGSQYGSLVEAHNKFHSDPNMLDTHPQSGTPSSPEQEDVDRLIVCLCRLVNNLFM